MPRDATKHTGKVVPLWVVCAAAALASVEPFTHVWLAYFPPGGTVFTGLHTGDSHVYLHSMRAAASGFLSPYASCASALGEHSPAYFALPSQLLYVALGIVATKLSLDYFLALGLFNGLFGFVYLLAIFRFMATVAPRYAAKAFGLFILGGSPAGLLYLGTGMAGLHGHADFDVAFYRFAAYDLMEGAHAWPVTLMPRMYYTLPLALGLGAFVWVHRSLREGNARLLWGSSAMLLAAQILNMRCGTFVFAAICIYLYCTDEKPWRDRLSAGAVLSVPVFVGGVLTVWLSGRHPSYTANQFEGVHESIWFSALVGGTVLYLILVPRTTLRAISRLPWRAGIAAWGLVGYLVLFTVLYAGYVAYYGGLSKPNDVVSAITVSDWALLGLTAGLGYALLRPKSGKKADTSTETAWIHVWLIAFVVLGISAWGHGWYMQLVPRRLLVLIGIPLSLAGAEALAALTVRRPRAALVWMSAYGLFGLTTVAVAALFFQGPLGFEPGGGPFPEIRYALMTEDDAMALDSLPPGRVLTPLYNPWCFSEVIALRSENRVAAGVGTFNHSDLPFKPTVAAVHRFFAPETPESERLRLVEAFCVDLVYCPDTCPVPPKVIEELEHLPWLEPIERAGRAVIFQVIER